MNTDIHSITREQLAGLGMQQIAYIKPAVVNGNACFSIHAADGTQMALAGELDIAWRAVVEHEMVPVRVH